MAQVRLKIPRQPLLIGSYAVVPYRVAPGSGIAVEDIDFKIPDGLAGGRISLARQAGLVGDAVMLLAGYAPGQHDLVVFDKRTGAIIGRGAFEITDARMDGNDSANAWSDEQTTLFAPPPPPPSGPENYNLCPAPARLDIALVLVDTASTRFSGNLQAERGRWLDEAEKGVVLPDGKKYSTSLYFSEVSYGALTLTATWCGEVHLAGSWDQYMIEVPGSSGPIWFPGQVDQAAITALGPQFDFSRFSTIVFLLEPDTTRNPSTKTVACAPHPGSAPVGSPTRYKSASGADVYVKPVLMSRDAGQSPTDIRPHRTLAHELGHTLGLSDLYAPAVPTGGWFRNTFKWDVMSNEGALPGLSLPHRLRLGWVPPAAVRTFDLRNGPMPATDVALKPLQLGAAGNACLGVELRQADGWSYYVEYRQRQAGQIADQHTSDPDASTNDAPGRVLNFDTVITRSFTAPMIRPDVLYAGPDDRGSYGPLDKGQDYKETLVPDPSNPLSLDIDVVDIDGTKANLRLQHGVLDKPDPSIRPWGAPGWQSPDIEVSNGKTKADPARYKNIPWAGNDNTITAWVTNRGPSDAPGVQVDFFVADAGSNAARVRLGTTTADVLAGQRVPFELKGWRPPSNAANGGHYCVEARIRLYRTPNGAIEITELNNVAQSNYLQFISSTASPASRESAAFAVQNPYSEPTVAFISSTQDNPLFVTYLEHRWVLLGPREVRQIAVMFEYLPDLDEKGMPKDSSTFAEFHGRPCVAGVAASILEPTVGVVVPLGGVDARILTGRATCFSEADFDAEVIRGRIVAADDGTPVPAGTVLVTKRFRQKRDLTIPERVGVDSSRYERTMLQTSVGVDGRFEHPSVKLKGELKVYYLGVDGFADCETRVRHQAARLTRQ